MDWKHLRCVALLLNRHRDRGFGADWAKREAALVGGLFHFIHRALNSAIAFFAARCTIMRILRRARGDRPEPRRLSRRRVRP